MRRESHHRPPRAQGPRPLWLHVGGVFVNTAAAIALVAWLLSLDSSPGAGSGAQKYFIALSQPLAVLAAGFGGLLVSRLLSRWPAAWMTRAVIGVFAVAGADALFIAPGLGRRAETSPAAGQTEGCLTCHAGITGLGDFHQPENIGCASCHAGNPRALDATQAHAGMVLVPGNLADAPRTCGTAGCHQTIVPRIEHSIMTTFAGVIATDRRVFGEHVDPASPPPHVRDLGTSAADSHLRQLCASCHLGQTKSEWGPISQESRGGGCNACHLNYSPDATHELARYAALPAGARTAIPKVHPALTVNIGNDHCFGCHSRSGRISTNYEGWHELREPPPPAELAANSPGAPRFRQLDDGRYFVRVLPDVHEERGLDCIDCHSAAEVMGTGAVVAHKTDQVQLHCEDCHASRLGSRPASSLDPESVLIAGVRRWSLEPGQRFGTTQRGGPLVNVTVDDNGRGSLRRKRTGETVALTPPLPVCTDGQGHARLSCSSCHTAWAPRCASCHTSFEPATKGFDHLRQTETNGAWAESSGPFEAVPPTLGIRLDPSDPSRPNGVVDTFVPGMILNLDRNRDAAKPADPVFRRLYARTFSHTIRREARSCQSCHNDPVALGYGEGALRYEISGDTGRWRFTPAHAALPADGLPGDAWTGFMQTRKGFVATRDDVRPFTTEEQRRILRVGACLTCHAGDSPVMRQSVANFDALLARRRPQCVIPLWP